MADDTGALCNSTKNHLQLTLDQPTKYTDDIEAGGTFPDTDDEHFEDPELGEKGSDEEVDGMPKELSTSTKIPLLYQVEPGCTPLSCYSAILTFIVMTLGIFWLLLISPPKNSVPVPVPVPVTEEVYAFADSYDDLAFYSSSPSSSATAIPSSTVAAIARRKAAEALDALDLVIPKHIVDDSGT